MSRYLIVANQTLGGKELEERIRTRIEGSHGRFYVLVPIVEPEVEADAWVPADPAFGIAGVPNGATEAMEVARERSQHRLSRMIDKIRSLGGEADGEIGSPDPLTAVEELLERETFDEIIVSTLPAGISRWLKLDLPSRIARHSDVPVTTVEAEA